MSLPTPYYDEDGITIYHGDCREILPQLPKVDLVLTDPPYGINADSEMHKNGGKQYGKAAAPKRVYLDTNWDSKPPARWLLEQILEKAEYSVFWGGELL